MILCVIILNIHSTVACPTMHPAFGQNEIPPAATKSRCHFTSPIIRLSKHGIRYGDACSAKHRHRFCANNFKACPWIRHVPFPMITSSDGPELTLALVDADVVCFPCGHSGNYSSATRLQSRLSEYSGFPALPGKYRHVHDGQCSDQAFRPHRFPQLDVMIGLTPAGYRISWLSNVVFRFIDLEAWNPRWQRISNVLM